MTSPRTLFAKVWDAHVVADRPPAPVLLYIDLHLVHEVTSPQAFEGLRKRGLHVRRPDRTFATVDHSIPTLPGTPPDPLAAAQIDALERNAKASGIRLLGKDDPRRGIVHVVGPEFGLTQPGMTVVCGDSHTSTHGAFGALAFGIGTSEVEHVLAAQALLLARPKTFEVRFEGRLGDGVTAKDAILTLLSKIGVSAGTGHVFEYTGDAVRRMNMDERMTLCNMSIEGGARAGMIAPDDTTYEYLAGREYSPREFERAVAGWRTLSTDPGAAHDRSVTISLDGLEPMLTFGTNPAMGIPVTGRVPDPARVGDPGERSALEKALAYMGFAPGDALLGRPVNAVFIGSCTNSRITDLREAARVMRGRKVAPAVRTLVVPGSYEVKRQAEAEGLDRVFRDAGAEWREPGCSMCIAMNGDEAAAGEVVVSTSNRNFEGRQGRGSRTILASPASAAAASVSGTISDARRLA